MWVKVAAVFNFAVILFWLYQWGSFAVAFANSSDAPSDPVPPCEAINTTGAIIVYRCLPDEGPSYLVNSFGFMILEE